MHTPAPKNEAAEGKQHKKGEMKGRRKAAWHNSLEGMDTVKSLLPHYTHHDRVASFLQAVTAFVIPNDMWGSPHNKAIVFHSMYLPFFLLVISQIQTHKRYKALSAAKAT